MPDPRRADRAAATPATLASAAPAPPAAGGPEAQYRAFLRAGRFMVQRSRSTGRHVFYPRLAAPGTGETDLEWVEASGLGTVHATTVNRTREGAYNICLVELDEGPRLMSRVEGIAPEAVRIGMRVRARIAQGGGGGSAGAAEPILLFDPVA
jgi:uncharacterized OB-fold protein